MSFLRSIRGRLTAWFALGAGALLLLASLAIMMYAAFEQERQVRGLLESTAQKLQREAMEGETSEQLHETLADIPGYQLALLRVDPAGRVVGRSHRQAPDWPLSPDSGWRVHVFSMGRDTGVLGVRWEPHEEALRDQSLALLLLSGVIFAAALGGARALIGRTLAPIGELSQQAREARGDPQVRLEPPSRDAEIVELVDTLNDLLERLGRSAAARGRFYAAASHELRTPLQALSGHLELALNQPRSADEYRRAIEEASCQTGRLAGLVRSLLLLNQLETAASPDAEEVELDEACREALDLQGPVGEASGVVIHTRLDEVRVRASRPHVDMLVGNLVQNALKYGRRGGAVQIVLERIAAGGARLSLFNECEAPPEWDESRLFEPFYRTEAHRNSRTGGNGLGLAICRAVADANGWTLAVRGEGAGVRAEVEFPGPVLETSQVRHRGLS